MNYNLPMYQVLLIILVIIIIYYLKSLIFTKRPSLKERKYAKKRKAFKGDNYKFTFTNINILCRYSIDINSYNGRPFVHHLKLYCNNHNPLLEIYGGKCNVYGCSSNKIEISSLMLKEI